MRASVAAALALVAVPAIAAEEDAPPRIVVSGTATVATPPDVAIINYSVRGEGTTSDEAVAQLAARRRAIEGGLAGFGRPRSNASQIEVAEVRARECASFAPRISTGACAIIGYAATLQLEIRTGAVGDAATMVGLIGRLGGTNPRLGGFAVANAEEPRRRALAAALAAARKDAEALAAAAGTKLGPLIAASDGSSVGTQIPQSDRRLEADTAPAPPPPPPPPIPVEITPQPIETQARVTVAYRLLP